MVERVQTHQHAKFCQNRSVGCKDINIFRFFKMATAANLGFRNREFLFAASICGALRHHCTKFHQNRSFHCGYCDFSNFQDGHCRHLGFWNRKILLVTTVQWVETHQLAKFCQNRSIGCKDINIFRFSRWRPLPSWIFEIVNFYLLPLRHHCTKFRRNRSFHCGDIAIFRIFQMAAAAILDFWNREILLVTTVQRMETHQLVEFCQNWSVGCKDINIFRFFKMATAAILGFRNREFLFAAGICRALRHHCTKFIKIARSIAEILQFFEF